MELRLRKDPVWEAASASHTATSPAEVTIVANNPRDYVHMTVRVPTGVPGKTHCSFVQVDSIQAELLP